MKQIFVFQAEDGIRDYKVTGVQTCALPISRDPPAARERREAARRALRAAGVPRPRAQRRRRHPRHAAQIGRASCRESVEIAGVAAAWQRKRARAWARPRVWMTQNMRPGSTR